MIAGRELAAGTLVLRRAQDSDLDALVDLQRSAYARNRTMLGVEPIPLQADYAAILREMEVWLARDSGERLIGALILEPSKNHMLIWSIATAPTAQGNKTGNALLGAAEYRARQLGLNVVRLYTGTILRHLVEWYSRQGYAVERIETLSDRSITHMIKHLDQTPGPAR